MDRQDYDLTDEELQFQEENRKIKEVIGKTQAYLDETQEELDKKKAKVNAEFAKNQAAVQNVANAYSRGDDSVSDEELEALEKGEEIEQVNTSEKELRPVTGRRDPRMARAERFLKVEWIPKEISRNAETLSQNDQFKQDFMAAADELLGAGKFLWTGSKQYSDLKKSVKECRELMQKQEKMNPTEYNKQLQNQMEQIIQKTGDYLKYKSDYSNGNKNLQEQSTTAQERYTAANKMWNLMVDQKKETEIFHAFSEREAIHMRQAEKKIQEAEKTLNNAKKTEKKAEQTVEKANDTIQKTQNLVKESEQIIDNAQKAVQQAQNEVKPSKQYKVNTSQAPKVNAAKKEGAEEEKEQHIFHSSFELNDAVRIMNKKQGVRSKSLRQAVEKKDMNRARAALSRMIIENRSLSAAEIALSKYKGKIYPRPLQLLSVEEKNEKAKQIGILPAVEAKCKELFEDPKKLDDLLSRNKVELANNLKKLDVELGLRKKAPAASSATVKTNVNKKENIQKQSGNAMGKQ